MTAEVELIFFRDKLPNPKQLALNIFMYGQQ